MYSATNPQIDRTSLAYVLCTLNDCMQVLGRKITYIVFRNGKDNFDLCAIENNNMSTVIEELTESAMKEYILLNLLEKPAKDK